MGVGEQCKKQWSGWNALWYLSRAIQLRDVTPESCIFTLRMAPKRIRFVIVYKSGPISFFFFCEKTALDELFKCVEWHFRFRFRSKLLRFQMWRQSSQPTESDQTQKSSQATILPYIVIRTHHPLHSTQSSPLNSTGAMPLARICLAVKHNLKTATTVQEHEWSLNN